MSGTGRFDYVRYDNESIALQESLKPEFERLTDLVTLKLKPGRAQALVYTKLEEAYMWAGKAIRDEQIKRNGSAELQEERRDDGRPAPLPVSGPGR